MKRSGALAFAMVLAATFAPRPAEACGGFFCSLNQPVNQAAERIVFVTHDDLSVTALIQIQYQGPSEQFSWVLPVSGAPEVAVSSNVAFARLQSATNPQYVLNFEVEGECDPSAPVPDAATGGDGDGDGDPDGGGVTVVQGGSVGPYDYETISVDPELEDPAQVAIDWLTDNGYDVGELGPDVLRPYLEDGLNLIAFRLQKEASAGSIRPVAITYEGSLIGSGQAAGGKPAIPIRPTAVAANDDMGVMVWTVGPARAVPTNYRSLILNDALINWFNPNSNYNDVVNLAADEAGGHGFVTEMAQPSSEMTEVVWSSSEEAEWLALAADAPTLTDGDVLLWTSRYAGWDGYLDAVRSLVPLPDGVTAEELAQCPGCYYADDEAIPGFDAGAFLDRIESDVIEPMRATQDLLLEQDYITRLYTTMSADEMTEDPQFDFNPTLADVDNVHTATRIIECSEDVFQFDAPWRADLPSGLHVRGEGRSWPIDLDDGLPANLQVLQDETMGPPEVVQDNTEVTTSTLAELNAQVPGASEPEPETGPEPDPTFTPWPTGAGDMAGGWCACARPGRGPAAGLGALALLGGLAGLRRRRR